MNVAACGTPLRGHRVDNYICYVVWQAFNVNALDPQNMTCAGASRGAMDLDAADGPTQTQPRADYTASSHSHACCEPDLQMSYDLDARDRPAAAARRTMATKGRHTTTAADAAEGAVPRKLRSITRQSCAAQHSPARYGERCCMHRCRANLQLHTGESRTTAVAYPALVRNTVGAHTR